MLLDYPAGTLPVRNFTKADKKGEMKGEILGSWDKVNRALCKLAVSPSDPSCDADVYQGMKSTAKCMWGPRSASKS